MIRIISFTPHDQKKRAFALLYLKADLFFNLFYLPVLCVFNHLDIFNL